MKFFIDECVYQVTTDFLIEQGHDVITVQQAGLTGYKNGFVLERAINEKRIFLTRDIHFTNIFLFPPENTYGIIVLKIKPEIILKVHNILLQLLNKYSQVELEKTLVIVDRNKYRIRK
jgi:predicted nuclease of predicted toxin-antitoxin system